MSESDTGTVYLVGAGPGDPDLLTVRGAELLARADAVVFDALSNPALLDRVPPRAERFDVGKRAGRPGLLQAEISELLEELARHHGAVVRLKGGDPFVFGRGGEEALALSRAGIPFQVVPGVTSAVGALAYAGIPLTHRGVASGAVFRTGHRAAGGAFPPGDPSPADTLVVFMGLGRLREVATGLVRTGRSPDAPAAVISRGTWPDQRTVVGTLADIADRVRQAAVPGPALVVVGDVVHLRRETAWFPEAPESPGGRAEDDPGDPGPWVVFTSPAAVAGGLDAASTPGARILAAGAGTDRALRARGARPEAALGATSPPAIAAALRAGGPLEGRRVLLVTDAGHGETLGSRLRRLGARVAMHGAARPSAPRAPHPWTGPDPAPVPAALAATGAPPSSSPTHETIP